MRTATPKDWAILVGAIALGFVLAAVLPDWGWQAFSAVVIVTLVVLMARRRTVTDRPGTPGPSSAAGRPPGP